MRTWKRCASCHHIGEGLQHARRLLHGLAAGRLVCQLCPLSLLDSAVADTIAVAAGEADVVRDSRIAGACPIAGRHGAIAAGCSTLAS